MYPPLNLSIEDVRGATAQFLFFLSRSKILTSKFCAIKKQFPEPIAILIEIMSEKFVETKKLTITPIKRNQNKQFFWQLVFHKLY